MKLRSQSSPQTAVCGQWSCVELPKDQTLISDAEKNHQSGVPTHTEEKNNT